MDRQEQFLRYIDDELTPEERRAVEDLLHSDAGAREQMDSVKKHREEVFRALASLDPAEDILIPPFIRPGFAGIPRSPVIRYAAAAVLLIGLSVTLWLLNSNKQDSGEGESLSEMPAIEPDYDDLDCYISPNRCWNERKLSLIIIEIK